MHREKERRGGRMAKRWAFTLGLLLGWVTVGARGLPQDAPVNPDARLLQEFQERIEQYMALRDRMEKASPPLKQTDDPAKIKASQDALAQKIRAARSGARQGDIFTPDIARHFRKLMRPELKGPDALATKKTIKDDAPPAIALKVNASYPENAPLPTVPPNLLIRLPKLPEDLEYRVVGSDLILRDAHANVIVDFIPGATR
jgi:hypothetical protein